MHGLILVLTVFRKWLTLENLQNDDAADMHTTFHVSPPKNFLRSLSRLKKLFKVAQPSQKNRVKIGRKNEFLG